RGRARSGRRIDPGGRRAPARATDLERVVSGHRAVVPGLVVIHAAARRRGNPRRLHRARRALRKLHPPDHDPLGIALGRGWRAARADAAALRFERHRARRRDPADRHRQEKRDHDDRLCAAGRAAGGQEPARGDPSGLPLALPADHDDDIRRLVRRNADRLRPRRRLRAAATVGRGHRRRPLDLAMADALHDAGHLSLPGTPRPLDWPSVSPVARAGSTFGCPPTGSCGGPSYRRMSGAIGLATVPPAAGRERLRRLAAGSIVAIAAVTAPLDPSGGAEPAESAESEIRSAIENWRTAFNARDEERLCALFAPDLVANYQGEPERDYASLCEMLRAAIRDPAAIYL